MLRFFFLVILLFILLFNQEIIARGFQYSFGIATGLQFNVGGLRKTLGEQGIQGQDENSQIIIPTQDIINLANRNPLIDAKTHSSITGLSIETHVEGCCWKNWFWRIGLQYTSSVAGTQSSAQFRFSDPFLIEQVSEVLRAELQERGDFPEAIDIEDRELRLLLNDRGASDFYNVKTTHYSFTIPVYLGWKLKLPYASIYTGLGIHLAQGGLDIQVVNNSADIYETVRGELIQNAIARSGPPTDSEGNIVRQGAAPVNARRYANLLNLAALVRLPGAIDTNPNSTEFNQETNLDDTFKFRNFSIGFNVIFGLEVKVFRNDTVFFEVETLVNQYLRTFQVQFGLLQNALGGNSEFIFPLNLGGTRWKFGYRFAL